MATYMWRDAKSFLHLLGVSGGWGIKPYTLVIIKLLDRFSPIFMLNPLRSYVNCNETIVVTLLCIGKSTISYALGRVSTHPLD